MLSWLPEDRLFDCVDWANRLARPRRDTDPLRPTRPRIHFSWLRIILSGVSDPIHPCEGIDRYHRAMVLKPVLWLNRPIDLIGRTAYMSENKLAVVIERAQIARYALIELRWSEVFPELVIVHCDDESLRQRIAARNIVGIAFICRDATIGRILSGSSNACDSKELLDRPASRHGDGDRELQSPSLPPQHRVGLTTIRETAFATLQRGIAAGVLMFYSTSIVGAAIRALVGA